MLCEGLKMIYCSNCGEKIKASSNFCSKCGSPVDHNYQEPEKNKKKTGELRSDLCPNCGSILSGSEIRCKSCGYDLRRTTVVRDFDERLERANTVKKRNQLIYNFYLPNLIEDMYDFFILAISNLNTDLQCEDAWKQKVDQIYHKAQTSFKRTPEFQHMKQLYQKGMKEYKRRMRLRAFKNFWKVIIGLVLSLGALALLIFGVMQVVESNDSSSPYYILIAVAVVIFFVGGGMMFSVLRRRKPRRDDEEGDEEE
jgi:predicted amidophosphoribosyltransferase